MTRHRLILTLEAPAHLAEREATADLRRVLKRVLRPCGWRCVGLATPSGSHVGPQPPAETLDPQHP